MLGEDSVLILQDQRTAVTNTSTIDKSSFHVLGSMLALNLHFGERNGSKIRFSKAILDLQTLSTTHCCKKSEGNENLRLMNICDYLEALLLIPGVTA